MMRARRAPRTAHRGFTLVELIVALSAGLLVSGAAYLLAKNSMKSYQDESRIATSQVAASGGLARMQADLQRAGYMSSPNILEDKNLCPSFDVDDVPLAAVALDCENSGLPASYGYGGVNPIDDPDVVVVSGNMTSTEQLEYRLIDSGTVFLAMDRGPMQRLLRDIGHDVTSLREVFVHLDAAVNPVNPRLARIIDQSGKQSYVIVTDVEVDSNAGLITEVRLKIQSPDGTAPSNPGNQCGYVNRGTGLINPVSIVRYRVAQICDPYDVTCQASAYGPAIGATNLAPSGDLVTAESVRAELLREELSPTAAKSPFDQGLVVGSNGLTSQEIVAEFAVDLNFAAVAENATGDDLIPYGFADGDSIEDPAVIPPQRFRSLRVRFATRARVPDREAPGPDDVTTRFLLTPIPAAARYRYARMRTLYTDIQLPNLAGLTW